MFRLIKLLWLAGIVFITNVCMAQTGSITGKITAAGLPVEAVTVVINDSLNTISDKKGEFHFSSLNFASYNLKFTAIGFQTIDKQITVNQENVRVNIELVSQSASLGEVVVTGTLKPVIRSESPVPVEVYTPQFLKKKSNSFHLRSVAKREWRKAADQLQRVQYG